MIKLVKYAFLVFMLFAVSLVQAAISVRADRDPVNLNESFKLIFEADEAPDGDPDFSPLEQFFVLINTSQSSNISIINGEYKRKISWTLQLMPKRQGKFVIPAIRFGDDKTKPLQISVQQASEPNIANPKSLFLEMLADKKSVYVQGQVIVTLRLMSDSNISRFEFGELQIDHMDVVVESLGDEKNYQTRIGNKPYLVIEKKYALFPQQSGDLKIMPATVELQLQSRSRSVFDPFQTRGEIRRARAAPITLEVLTPAAAFSGAHWLPSSQVQLSEEWQGDLKQLVAGEPVTRTIKLLAKGQTAAQLPELAPTSVDGVKFYPDKVDTQNQLSDSGIVALTQQKIALIPSANGSFELPEIVIPWWNVDSEKQEYARLPARTIQVVGAVHPEPAPTSGESAQNISDSSGVGIAPVVTQAAAGSVNSFWMWFSLVLACGWLVSGITWWYRGQHAKQSVLDKLQNIQNSFAKARKALRQAANNQQARQTRECLLAWANALNKDRFFNNLDEVASYFGDPLRQQINQLNQSIYSARQDRWDSTELLRACDQIEVESKKAELANTRNALLPLNPEARMRMVE